MLKHHGVNPSCLPLRIKETRSLAWEAFDRTGWGNVVPAEEGRAGIRCQVLCWPTRTEPYGLAEQVQGLAAHKSKPDHTSRQEQRSVA